MVRPANGQPGIKMVEMKAVEPRFPLYGTLTLESGRYSHELLRGGGVLVRPELLAQLKLKVGDRIFIGTKPFEIRGVIKEEPGRSVGAFSIGPRILIDYADIPSTGLLSFGSRVSRQILLMMTRARHGAGGVEPARGIRQRVRPRPRLLVERRSHGAEPGARRELSQPGRAGRADPRRHRRLERHPRLHPAEGAEHRHPEVRRQHHGQHPGDLHDAGRGPGSGRQRPRRRARRRRDCRCCRRSSAT